MIGIGLFGVVGAGGIVRDLDLSGAMTSGLYSVGTLTGKNYGLVDNVTSTDGDLTGSATVGGIVGKNFGSISDAGVTGGTVGSAQYVGGLVGYQTTPNGVAVGTYA